MKCRHLAFTFNTIQYPGLHFHSWTLRRLSKATALLVLLFTGLEGCRDSVPESGPVTITLLDPGWPDKEFVSWRKHEEEDFTHETGILVRDLPAPETAVDQLALWRKLLQSPSEAPDVFAIDVIWPALMADYSLSLNSYFNDTAQYFPKLVANDMVNGQLVALPYHADAGLLFYRTDLLQAYGYPAPPETWGELEKMALRIQKGERSKGKKGFWGFVWQGAASEALTCNALEWQVSEGGGQIIEGDGTISVNNPRTIGALERAARWVGTISPPSVTAYREWDALNIWQSGNAAFMRNWPPSYTTSHGEGSVVGSKFAVALLPGGTAGRTGTLGGASLSVFRNSRHRKEAVALVRYLCRRDVELARVMATAQPPVFPDLYDLPEVIKTRPHFAGLKRLFGGGVAVRPSTVTGAKYAHVSQAYSNAVHSVLTKDKKAAQAVSDLEVELVRVTGLKVRRTTLP